MKWEFHYPPEYKKMKKYTATITPKDAGLLIAYTYLSKDDIVLEAGGGSAFFTGYIARIAKRVIVYEKDKRFIQGFKKNFKYLNFTNVELIEEDIFEEPPKEKFDVIFLDFKDSAKFISSPFFKDLLKPNTRVGVFLSNVEFVREVFFPAKELFEEVFVIEAIAREWKIEKLFSRPEHKGLLFTSFLLFARKPKIKC